jgi:5-methylcytosine-specific restriction protein A
VTPREPRLSSYRRGYTKQWDQAAKDFRVRYPLCGMRPGGQAPVLSQCYVEQRVTAATVTDHVVPHRGDRVLFWDVHGNWQSMCGSCHTTKTQREGWSPRGAQARKLEDGGA